MDNTLKMLEDLVSREKVEKPKWKIMWKKQIISLVNRFIASFAAGTALYFLIWK